MKKDKGERERGRKRLSLMLFVSALQNLVFARQLACISAAQGLHALAIEYQLFKHFSASSQIHTPSGCSDTALVPNPLTGDSVHEQK